MVKFSEVLQYSDVLLVLSFLSLCMWLYVLYIFVSFCKLCILIVMFVYYCYVYSAFIPATLTEVFPCFSLSCKANARVYPTKTGHGPHSS